MKQQRILMLGNYSKDGQHSMFQFADLVESAAIAAGYQAERWSPPVILGRRGNPLRGWGKLAGYADKYLFAMFIFSIRWLWRYAKKELPDLVHIVDHSNAIYRICFPGATVLVTCHDLIAVRRARGEFAVPLPRISGRLQQSWIFSALQGIKNLSFVSLSSQNDYFRLSGKTEENVCSRVIYPCLAQKLSRLLVEDAEEILCEANLQLPETFIFHHGSASWYKNREMVIDVFLKCRGLIPGLGLVIGGAGLSAEQKARLNEAGEGSQCVETGFVSSEILQALYSRAAVFLFPSWVEGFGWPPVEAQQCGCPVVVSDVPIFREVLEDSALFAGDSDVDGFVQEILLVIENTVKRRELVDKGYRNVERFSQQRFDEEYREMYKKVINV